MKKLMLALLAITGAIVLNSCSGGGGGTADAGSYNNKLMTIINANEQSVTAMNTAMSTKNYAKAEEVRKTWESSLTEQIAAVEKIGAFDGDDGLQKGVLEGLNSYKKIVTDDYKSLIAIRTAGTADEAAAAKEKTALDNINNTLESAANGVNKAASAFEKKYAK